MPILSELLDGGGSGFGVARAEKDMKAFARELARNFKTDPLVCASDERDFLVFHALSMCGVEFASAISDQTGSAFVNARPFRMALSDNRSLSACSSFS